MACPHGQDESTCATCADKAPTLDRLGEAPTVHREAVTDPAVPLPSPSAHPDRIGRFVVIERIGQGGMGVVLAAYDPALDRKVAIKLLRADRASGTQRLAREAQAMARLAHPNVVPVYDVGVVEGALFVAMEFVAGTTLHEWLKARPRDWREVLAVLTQAGRGLEAAHAAGIVHRDFKPANVLVGTDGRARVTDFGLARAETSSPASDPALSAVTPISLETPITLAGSVMGSPGYMAPEQYAGQPTSPATDQYAFCVTLYEALYGRRPFVAGDMATLTRLAHEGAVPAPPKERGVPAWLFGIVARGLSPDPRQRYASMSALLAALGRDPSVSRRRWLGATAATLLTLGGAFGVWAWPQVRASGCHRETDRLAEVWNDDARRRTEAAFRATREPFADTAWEHARATLDAFLAGWKAERHAACDEALAKGAQTGAQLTLRLGCLERRHAELETLATRFQLATPDVVAQSATAVARLTPVERCANLTLLERRATLAPAARLSADAIEQQLAQGRMLVALGVYDDARRVLDDALASARTLADHQTLALALLEHGILEREAGNFDEARQSLEEGLRMGLESGDDHTALHAIALLASIIGWRNGEPLQAFTLVNVGRGLAAKVGAVELEALLDEGEGDARWRHGEQAKALESYRRARDLFAKLEGSSGLDVARLEGSIGWVQLELGAFKDARESLERSRRARERLLGLEHPLIAQTWNELGYLAQLLDDWPAAIEAFRRCIATRERASGAGRLLLLRSRLNLARVLVLDGKLDEAEALIAKAEAAGVEGISDFEGANVENVRAGLYLARGRPADALAAAQRAVSARSVSDPSFLADTHLIAADALVALRRYAEALARADEAKATYLKVSRDRSNDFVHALTTRTAIVLALGRQPRDALATAREAEKIALSLEGNVRPKVEASLAVAEAAWAVGERKEAVAAAASAEALARDAGREALRLTARAWLDAHPAP